MSLLFIYYLTNYSKVHASFYYERLLYNKLKKIATFLNAITLPLHANFNLLGVEGNLSQAGLMKPELPYLGNR